MNLLIMVFFLLFSSLSSATTLKNIVVFGDSLSDNGNLYEFTQHQIPLAPYYEGRFSNGLVWVEQLAEMYYPKHAVLHLKDFAFGGAGVADVELPDMLRTLSEEVDEYLLTNKNVANPRSLFVLWIGANNYFEVPKEIEEKVSLVMAGINKDMERLVQKGAKHILLMNLPDLGKIPSSKMFDVVKELSCFSRRHNEELAKLVDSLRARHPEVHWMVYDAKKAFDEVMQSPKEYGFSNITDACYNFNVDKSAHLNIFTQNGYLAYEEDPSCEGYLFFDIVHSTVRAHQILASQVDALLKKEGISFG